MESLSTYAYTIDGELVHMGRTNDDSFELHLKTFVDMFTIARAEKIYLLRTGQMYKSGFPATASRIYGKPLEIVEF